MAGFISREHIQFYIFDVLLFISFFNNQRSFIFVLLSLHFSIVCMQFPFIYKYFHMTEPSSGRMEKLPYFLKFLLLEWQKRTWGNDSWQQCTVKMIIILRNWWWQYCFYSLQWEHHKYIYLYQYSAMWVDPSKQLSVAFWRSLKWIKNYKLDSVLTPIIFFPLSKIFQFLKEESSSLVTFIFLVMLQNLLLHTEPPKPMSSTNSLKHILSSSAYFSTSPIWKDDLVDPSANRGSFGEFYFNDLQNRVRLWTWKNFLLKLC